MTVLDLIQRVGKQESALQQSTFISPIFNNTRVATHIFNLIYYFIIPKTKGGWYRIKPVDNKRAAVIEPANSMEIESYLSRLDKLRLTLVLKRDGVYLGIPDRTNKYGFSDLLSLFLCDDSPLDFDRVIARYDGANIWFEHVDQSNDPAKAEYLRESMLKLLDPEKIKYSGLTVEERQAYVLRMTLDKKLARDRQKEGLKEHVEFAGGSFIKFEERKDHYSVTYRVDGQQFTSHVSKDPGHSVLSAGLCLNNNDKLFDMKSLVTVIREAQKRGIVHHFNLD